MCLALVKCAQAAAPALPAMNATHLLLLYYATAQGMSWHRDSDKNDGDNVGLGLGFVVGLFVAFVCVCLHLFALVLW
jgi:hypothetical protein